MCHPLRLWESIAVARRRQGADCGDRFGFHTMSVHSKLVFNFFASLLPPVLRVDSLDDLRDSLVVIVHTKNILVDLAHISFF